MLVAEKISRKFNGLTVLSDIDLELKAGEMVSIVGPSGAGKSTLLHLLGTLDQPDSGKIYVQGEDLTQKSPQALAQFRNQKLGFVFQFHHLLPEFTALENVCMPAWIGGQSKKAAAERALQLLDKVQLSARAHHLPQEMSGGEQQRVAVARALMNQPALILADEPTGNLDSQNARALHELFVQINQEFKTAFLVVTHNNELAQLCHRSLVLRDGKMVKD